ncbi:restriction endonuclease subunit S [Loigolactobacillus jiayinensis]|uniref:Restriction endonuclease subunit S n=1 Tax=Loigolactobacillus jiayinensis TaxID=2486016 RepID=A0ABW1RFQ8_9LACO|nr:restriction endonuclease subunit S [Loigolactobacillus jiayinensis]
MKDNQAKYPQLRFKGFTDPWEERKLGEEAQLTMGQSPNSENYTKNPDDYILVQGNADMKNGRVVPRVWTTQITKKAEKSDLILSVRAPVGDIGKTDYDVVLGRGVAAIKGNEFIFQQLGKMKLTGYWTRYSTGSTFESINSNDIKDAKIMVPVEGEQQKIGSFFQQLDHLITLHQRKLAKLKELKQGYLQKLFPKNGSKFPQLRFAGFADAWEQRKFDDLGLLARGKSKHRPRNDPKLYGGRYPMIQTGDVSSSELYITHYSQTYNETGIAQSKLWPKGTLAITIAANIADSAILDIPAAFPDSIIGFQSDKNNVLLIKYSLDFVADKIKSQADTSSQANLNLKKLSGMSLSVPKQIKEQESVASLLKKLDQTIASNQRKLEKLQELKKGYLQKMFC